MTETEWLTAREPWNLLNFVREGGASKRKLRLFTCACCRQVLNPFAPRLAERALGAAEAFADGAVRADLLGQVRDAVWRAFADASAMAEHGTGYLRHLQDACYWACESDAEKERAPGKAALAAARAAGDVPWPATGEFHRGHPDELANQAELLRDIFGNPFASVGLEPEWLTDTVVGMAKGVYADYAFDQLPVLADALQDAGCDSDDILDHCRDEREHVRGCWVVDLLLGNA